MSLYEYDEEKHIELERKDAVEKVNLLNRKLMEQKRMDDLKKSTVDFKYQEKLLKEFELI